jgi:hypothetical protein
VPRQAVRVRSERSSFREERWYAYRSGGQWCASYRWVTRPLPSFGGGESSCIDRTTEQVVGSGVGPSKARIVLVDNRVARLVITRSRGGSRVVLRHVDSALSAATVRASGSAITGVTVTRTDGTQVAFNCALEGDAATDEVTITALTGVCL